MKKMIMVAGLFVACSASAQLLQNPTQTIVQPEPAPVPVVQPQPVVQPVVQQVTTTTVQPVQQVTTTTVVPAPAVVAPPPPVIVVPPGYQTCPRCGGRGKEELALGFKVKRCKLCNGKGFLPPPPPPAVHHHHRHRRY